MKMKKMAIRRESAVVTIDETTEQLFASMTLNMSIEMYNHLLERSQEEGCSMQDIIRSLLFLDMEGQKPTSEQRSIVE